jgi:hypothetical protein
LSSKYVFQQSKIPNFNGYWARRLARYIWDLKLHYHDQRKPKDVYVRECDEAYLCHRYIPDTGAIRLIEDGEFGESDVHDNANIISIRLALALMPRNEQWLIPESLEEDATDDVAGLIHDLNMDVHRKARTRRNLQRYIKQLYVRGSSYLWYDWNDEYRYRRLTDDIENKAAFEKHVSSLGLSKKEAKEYTRGKQKELTFSGPLIQPIDYFDVWIEPLVDIVNNRRPSTILQRFRPLAKLMNEEDMLGRKLYSNLENVTEWSLEELYQNDQLAGGRYGSLRLFGLPPVNFTKGIKLVPTYVCYFPYLKFEGMEFWDTYFHILLDHKGYTPRIIRVEENPDDAGVNHLLMDHYVDHYVKMPYGISGCQYQLSKYHQKNFLQLLTITAAAHSVFPPNLVLESAFRSEEQLSFNAGDTIGVLDNPLGLDVIRPMTMPTQGSQLGQEMLRFIGDDLRAQSGVDGLTSDNPSRSLGKRKTATEVNADVSAGSFFLDNAAENITDNLIDLIQGTWQMMQQNLKPDSNDKIIFQRMQGDKWKKAELHLKQLKAERSITILGVNGQLNKQQEMQNLTTMFQAAATVQDPRVAALRVLMFIKMCKKSNIQVPPELEMNPAQAVAENPQAQIAAIQQALQNPQIIQAALQNPQIRQIIIQGLQGTENGTPQNNKTVSQS